MVARLGLCHAFIVADIARVFKGYFQIPEEQLGDVNPPVSCLSAARSPMQLASTFHGSPPLFLSEQEETEIRTQDLHNWARRTGVTTTAAPGGPGLHFSDGTVGLDLGFDLKPSDLSLPRKGIAE